MTDTPRAPDDCSKHPDHVIGWSGTTEELVKAIGFMRYDSMANFMTLLSDELRRQSHNDKHNGKVKLAKCLMLASDGAYNCAWMLAEVHTHCAPYMDK